MNNPNFSKEPSGGNSGSHYFTNPPEEPRYTAPLIDEAPPISGKFGKMSLIFGIIGLVCCCCCPVLPMIASILAIVFALVDRKRFNAFRGVAVAGLILGIIGTLFGAYMLTNLAPAFSLLSDPEFMRLYQEALETGDTAALEAYLEQVLGTGVSITV